MDYSVEKSAKTVREAISLALEEMNTDESNVEIEVLDEGSKGIFGIIGSKMAKVRLYLREQRGEKARSFLSDVLKKMSVNADIDLEEDEESILLRIKGKDIGIVIGRRGETLDSLQYLTSLVVNKNEEDYKRVVIDIENYRQRREETLERLAFRLADKVVRYKKDVILEPMNPFERRIIHSALQDNRYVNTYSIGAEPNRKVIITLK